MLSATNTSIGLNAFWGPYFAESYVFFDDNWYADYVPAGEQFGGTQNGTQQGCLMNTIGTAAAIPVEYDEITGAYKEIPMNGAVKVHKEHWFHFQAGTDSVGSHTWEWEQEIPFLQMFLAVSVSGSMEIRRWAWPGRLHSYLHVHRCTLQHASTLRAVSLLAESSIPPSASLPLP